MPNHPTHPATVHFPIAFTFLTGFLDALYYLTQHPSTTNLAVSLFTLLNLQLPASTLPILSYHTTRLTILSAIPSILSGIYELAPVIQRDGISSKKAQTGILHALVNDVTVFGAVWNWWTRSGVSGFVPSGANVLVSSALAVPSTLFAAYLGGSLVYQFGMGVGRGGSAAVKPVSKKGQ